MMNWVGVSPSQYGISSLKPASYSYSVCRSGPTATGVYPFAVPSSVTHYQTSNTRLVNYVLIRSLLALGKKTNQEAIWMQNRQ